MNIRTDIRNMTRAALFAAVMVPCAWIGIRAGDFAVTMQTFAVFLALMHLGGKWGTVAILIYLLLGAVGMPVFSGFQGGFGVLLGATGGYLWGFLFSGLTYWTLEKWGKLPAAIGGLLVCYLLGTLWFAYYAGGGLAFVLLRCVVPYILPDALKLTLAVHMAQRLK